MAHRWTSMCIQGLHDSCQAAERTVLPTRLISVSPDDSATSPDSVRLLLTSPGQRDHYVALSYCWGSQQTLFTTQANLVTFTRSISMRDLPKTITDAIRITRDLGFKYIWVDSICIIQDSGEDKAAEISKMHEVYQNATITISADRASDCQDGFLGPASPELEDYPAVSSPKISYQSLSGASGKVQLRSLAGYLPPVQPTDVRGWTFQEQILSPRILSFADQLRWRCPSGTACNFGDEYEDTFTSRSESHVRQCHDIASHQCHISH